MHLDNFTSQFQSAFSEAQSLALGKNQQFIEPVHMMKALLNQDTGTVRPLLVATGVDINRLNAELDKALSDLPVVEGIGGDVRLSNASIRILNICNKLAQQRGDKYIYLRMVYSCCSRRARGFKRNSEILWDFRTTRETRN